MTKKSRQKHKHLENEKGFNDEIKSIFHLFLKVIIEANKAIFLESESPTLIEEEEVFTVKNCLC